MSKNMKERQIILTPTQQQSFQWLAAALPTADVLILNGRPGTGKTTILRKLHANRGGILLNMRHFMKSLAAHQPSAIEEAFLRMFEQALERHDLVIADDLHLITQMAGKRNHERTYLLDASLTALMAESAVGGKKIVCSLDGDAPWPIRRRALSRDIGELAATYARA